MLAPKSMEIFAPKKFDEYVGQDRAKKIAQVMVSAAKIEGRPLPNIMIDGPYGTGKTSLAKVITLETHQTPNVVDALSIDGEFAPNRNITIIDEAHNLDPKVADSLNILIDKGRANIIACTTNPGGLPPAFRSRFRSIHLEHYTVKDIRLIVDLAAIRRGLMINATVLQEIATRSRLNPRVALNNLGFILDYMVASGASTVASRLVQEAFDVLGVDKKGFTQRDRDYLNALNEEGPRGIQYISSYTGVDIKTIETEIEPYLLQTGYIDRLPKGRIRLRNI